MAVMVPRFLKTGMSSGLLARSPALAKSEISGIGTARKARTGGGHAVAMFTSGVPQPPQPDEEAVLEKIREYEQRVPRLSAANFAHTLLKKNGMGMVASHSKEFEGYPFGSSAIYVADDKGRPIISLSSLSFLTKNITQDSRASLLVAGGSLSEPRLTLVGSFVKVEAADQERECRAMFSEKHPDAFFVNFGDFSFYRMEGLQGARLIEGFGRIKSLSPEQYSNGRVDPVAVSSSQQVLAQLNESQARLLRKAVEGALGMRDKVASASIVSMDTLGMDTEILLSQWAELLRVRIGFPRPIKSHSDLKQQIMELQW